VISLFSYYQKCFRQADFTYPWHEAVFYYLFSGKFDPEKGRMLKENTLSLDLRESSDYVLFFQRFLTLSCLSFLTQTSFSLEPLFQKALTHPYWQGSSLCSLSFQLCAHLGAWHQREEAMPSLEQDKIWSGGELTLQEEAESALLKGCLGLLKEDSELQERALLQAEWMLSLLDHEHFPFFSLFCAEESCAPLSLFAANHVLFCLCDSLTKEEKWHLASIRQLHHLEKCGTPAPSDLPLILPLLLALLKRLDPGLSFCVESSFLASPFIFSRQRQASGFALTLLGKNSGLGAFHKKGVKIVNCGPWAAPLGECRNFGIRRLAFREKELFFSLKSDLMQGAGSPKDFASPLESASSSLEGWTRLQPTPSFVDGWIHLKAREDKERLNLDLTLSSSPDAGVLFFAFLVQAKEAQVGRHRFLPATMRHYLGESALITFFAQEEKIEIALSKKGEIELIPLGGGRHFWGANFLLALAFSSSRPSLSCSIC